MRKSKSDFKKTRNPRFHQFIYCIFNTIIADWFKVWKSQFCWTKKILIWCQFTKVYKTLLTGLGIGKSSDGNFEIRNFVQFQDFIFLFYFNLFAPISAKVLKQTLFPGRQYFSMKKWCSEFSKKIFLYLLLEKSVLLWLLKIYILKVTKRNWHTSFVSQLCFFRTLQHLNKKICLIL